MPKGTKTENALAKTTATELTVDELALVEQTVSEINRIDLAGNLATAREIGGIIVARFFGGDVTRFHQQERTSVTWRALAKHADLQQSASSLWYAVAVYEHFEKLDEAVAGALSMAHHRLLAHVRQEDALREFATRTISEDLTAETLRTVIRDRKGEPQPDQPKRGRPTIPEVVKGLSKAKKALAGLHVDSMLDPAKRAQALTVARTVLDAATTLVAELERTGPA